ncbi:uncharacterized protein LOC130700516 [Daphnia carinata]|uniref:uncharacterized protein LOC130700516 n=1 Tax=Daphnia carinata TaxID=120202 RepID=UPI0028691D88|nr:uncharacterized protein LOC130700516 [Daphnia carinata]
MLYSNTARRYTNTMFLQLQLSQSFFYIQVIIILSLLVSSTEPLSSLQTRQGQVNNPLADQHLNVLWARRGGEYNSSYVGPKKGGLMVEYLARRFKFTYSFLKVNEIYLYAVGKAKRGLVDYLLEGQCDLIVHDVILTTENYKKMELTLPWHRSIIVFMVPVPLITTNLNAVIKPFQWPVWTGIGVSVIAIIFFLKLTDRSPLATSETSDISPLPEQKAVTGRSDEVCDRKSSVQTKKEQWNMYLYVFGMLLSQGGSCIRKHLSSRLVAGVWSLATFIFVQAYTSTLFTYIVMPSTEPLLVDSVYDVVSKPHIHLVIESGRGFESTIMNTQEKTGIFKQLRDKLMAFPKTRCYGASDCVALVKDGPNVVHGNAFLYVADYMINDFKLTGQCNFQVARESFWPIIVGFGLRKGSRYLEPINKGKANVLSHVKHFLLILVVVIAIRCVLAEAKRSIRNPLNGQHVRLIANVLILENEVNINNVSGALEGMKGVSYHMMDYLTHRFNFTYSIIQGIQTTSVQSKGQGDRGLIDWVIDGTAELMVGPLIINHGRYRLADLTLPWYQSYGYLLIPKPQAQANLTSVMKPFQWPVWIALLVSIAVVIVSMYFVSHFRWSIVSSFGHRTFSRRQKIIFKKSRTTSTTISYLYVVSVLLSQGENDLTQCGPCSSQKLAVRVLAAAWCLAAAVLVNSYSSVLITYILAPNNPPLVTSAYDLAQKDDVHLIVDKGRGVDIFITVNFLERYDKRI